MTDRDRTAQSEPAGGVERRVAEVADALRDALLPIARESAGGTLRPSRLSELLSVDKSLASRLVRGLRATSPFELIHLVPAPTGLRMILDAAEEAGVDAALLTRATRAVTDFQRLLDDFPGGRASLDTLISESVVEVRQRADRVAKQAVFKAMSHLLGFHCETVSSALVLQPSEDGHHADGFEVSRRAGIRRLRPSTPVAVFSVDLTTGEPGGGAPCLETLDGSNGVEDPSAFLLPHFCEPELPDLEILRDDTHHVFALSDAGASLESPITVASGLLVRDGWLRHRSNDQSEDGRSYLLHYPCKLLIRDLFIRDDLYVGALPEIRLEFPSPTGAARPRRNGLPDRLNTLDLTVRIEQLGTGLGNAAAAGAPEHARMLAHAFERTGWDGTRFRGYRTRIIYPVPMITMGWWIPLPRESA